MNFQKMEIHKHFVYLLVQKNMKERKTIILDAAALVKSRERRMFRAAVRRQ